MLEKIKKYRRNCICVFLTISLFVSPLTVGAEQTAPKTGREKMKTRVTISYTETPIETVLMDLADKVGINIIKSSKVTGDVTVKVTDVPLEEALIHILAVHDCTYIATENMIRVFPLPPQTEHKEQQVTRIYKITYADANEVYEALKKFVSGKAEIGFNKGTSHIMITDTEDKIKPIDKFIEQVDTITSQVLVEVRIYDVSTKEGFELSPDWHFGRNAPYTADTILVPDQIQTFEVGPETTGFSENVLNEYYNYTYGIDIVNAKDTQLQENVTTESGRTDIERTYENPGIITTNRRRKPFAGGS
ncbi:MAG: secretin N-terminal domain-containing protein, partial [Sedimentisphaerales bacterium]